LQVRMLKFIEQDMKYFMSSSHIGYIEGRGDIFLCVPSHNNFVL